MNGKEEHARGWLLKAESDRKTIEGLLAAGGPFDTACFHAQQEAEKLLKALLAVHDLRIPRTHNLEEIQRLCLGAVRDEELAALDLTTLTPYAVEMRYDFEFWPDEDTVREAAAIASKLRAIVMRLLPPSAYA